MSNELKFNNFDFNKNREVIYSSIDKETQDINVSKIEPTLYIGIGGSGKDVLLKMRENLFVKHEAEYKNRDKFPIEFLYYDLDPNWKGNDPRKLYDDEYFKSNVEFQEDEIFRGNYNLAPLLSNIQESRYAYIREWLSPILAIAWPGAGQQRQYSRLAFFDQYPKIRKAIKSKLDNIAININKNRPATGNMKINVIMVFSIAGGTGSGAFLDMAFLCRELLNATFPNDVDIKNIAAHIIMPSVFSMLPINHEQLNANSYAALKEIEHYMPVSRKFVVNWDGTGEYKSIPGPVFNECYLISGERYDGGKFENISDVLDIMSEYLAGDLNAGSKFLLKRNSGKSNCNDFLNRIVYSDIVDAPGKIFQDLNSFTCKYSSYGFAKLCIPSDRIKKSCSAILGKEIIELTRKNIYKPFNPTVVENSAREFANTNFIPVEFNQKNSSLADYSSPISMESKLIEKLLENPADSKENLLKKLEKEIKLVTDEFKVNTGQASADDYFNKFKDISHKYMKTDTTFEDEKDRENQFKKIVYDNLNKIIASKDENSENGLLKKVFFSMLEPSISRDYGLDKARFFMNELKNELVRYKNNMRVWYDKYGRGEIDKEFKNAIKNTRDAIENFTNQKNYGTIVDNIKETGLKDYENILKDYEEYQNQLTNDLAFKTVGKGLQRAGLSAVGELIKDIKLKKEKIEREIAEFQKKELEKFEAAVSKFFSIEFLRRILAEAVMKYYDDHVMKMFATGDSYNSKNYFLPFVVHDKITDVLNRLHNRMNDRHKFFENFKQTSNQILVRDGAEITNRNFNEIIKEYYDDVADEFTSLPENDLTNINKNKLDTYLKDWINNYNELKQTGGVNGISAFMDEISQKTSATDFESIYKALKKQTDLLIENKLKGRFNIFSSTKNSGADHIINTSLNSLFNISKVCISESPRYAGYWQHKISIPDVNHYRGVLVNTNYKDDKNFKPFFDLLKQYAYSDNVDDAIIFYSEFHGFPLFHCHALDAGLKEAYQKCKVNSRFHPLHIEHESKFKGLIPIFNLKKISDYQTKIKVAALCHLFGILKYAPFENIYEFKYVEFKGEPYKLGVIRADYGLTADLEKDNKIFDNGNSVSVIDFLECAWKAQEDKLNTRGKIKLYYGLWFQRQVIENNLETDREGFKRDPNKTFVSLYMVEAEKRRLHDEIFLYKKQGSDDKNDPEKISEEFKKTYSIGWEISDDYRKDDEGEMTEEKRKELEIKKDETQKRSEGKRATEWEETKKVFSPIFKIIGDKVRIVFTDDDFRK